MESFREIWNEENLLDLKENCKDLHEMFVSNKFKLNDVILIGIIPSNQKHEQNRKVTTLFKRRLQLTIS